MAATKKTATARTTKSLSPEEREHARAFTQREVDRHFWNDKLQKGVVLQAAKAWGISQSALQAFLDPDPHRSRGGGHIVISAIARAAGTTYDVVIGREPQRIIVTPGTPALGNQPGFDEVVAAARAAYPLVREDVWIQIAQSVIPGYKLTVEGLYDLARMIEPPPMRTPPVGDAENDDGSEAHDSPEDPDNDAS